MRSRAQFFVRNVHHVAHVAVNNNIGSAWLLNDAEQFVDPLSLPKMIAWCIADLNLRLRKRISLFLKIDTFVLLNYGNKQLLG